MAELHMTKLNEPDKRYFLVTHKFNGKRYRATAPSKNKLKSLLPRFSESTGYSSFWNVEEVDSAKYKRMSHLKDAPLFGKSYEDE